jgi:DNA-binding NarL/FixJ family response regulator
VARNGREAVDKAGRYQPTVVVLDRAMPTMDGLEALPEIGRVPPHSKIVRPVGMKATAMATQVLELGAERCVEKGADPEEVVRVIEQVAGLAA